MTEVNPKLVPAIPEHLRLKRTRPLGAPPDFQPQHASYSARFDPAVLRLPMIYVGVQHRSTVDVQSAIGMLERAFKSQGGPEYWDMARYEDEAGYTNQVLVGYWDNIDAFNIWQHELSDDWWYDGYALDGKFGFFKEAYVPSVHDTETTFSHPYPEGYAKIAKKMSDKTDTHEYWGAARDRIPRAQTDALIADSQPRTSDISVDDTRGRHIVVQPHENMCLLRSGQDWTETDAAERAFYLTKVKPFLDEGMLEIRDRGESLGCYFNRYMDLIQDGHAINKTYSLSAWHSLEELEHWVKTETHLAIWGAGIKHYKQAGDAAKLRLYHEMFVFKAEDQSFEYFNCHRQTGMLKPVYGLHMNKGA